MDRILILTHATLGGIALFAGAVALIAQKGKKIHRGSGKVFFYAMLGAALLAIGITILPGHYDPFLFAIGVFTSYLLVGGYRSLRFKLKTIDLQIDHLLSYFMLICAIGMLLLPFLFQGELDIVLAVFGGIGLAFAIRDLRFYKKPDLLRSSWLRIHIGKMTGAYIASITAFLVVNELLPYYLSWFLPTILGSIYIGYHIRSLKPKNLNRLGMILLFCGGWSSVSHAQVFIEKQTRYRFAQLNLGLDYQTSIGGRSAFLNAGGEIETFDLGTLRKPRFLLGGTHFWGHADFYIAIPLVEPKFETEGQELLYTSGVETVFKYYPWRITEHRFRPFLGTSLAPFYFEQDQVDFNQEGPQKRHFSIPLLSGITYNHKNLLAELSLLYNYQNKINYFLSRTKQTQIETPQLYLSFSLRYMIETTGGAEDAWESGRTASLTEKLAQNGGLNSFYVGAGMSSAWWLGNSTYNETNRPFISGYGISLMPDFTMGYYVHQPDVNLALSYRSYNAGTSSYGVTQNLSRRSLGLEVTKYVLDYHGFAPFIGPVLSYEDLSFRERFEQGASETFQEKRLAYGITFGWDVRPNRIQTFLLRTNLRYFPSLQLDVSGDKQINFSNLEFNFIQLILFLGRI